MHATIAMGSVFQGRDPPRRLWRVAGVDRGLVTLERLDKPSTLRFVREETLADDTRYRPHRAVDGPEP